MKKILIVDDEPDIIKLLQRTFEPEFKVVTASSGKEALKKLKKDFDLVLMDHFMPNMSGVQLLERIRKDKKLKNLKCAFLTVANFGDTGMGKLKKLKSLDYIKKPFSTKDILIRVKKIT